MHVNIILYDVETQLLTLRIPERQSLDCYSMYSKEYLKKRDNTKTMIATPFRNKTNAHGTVSGTVHLQVSIAAFNLSSSMETTTIVQFDQL